MPESKKQEGSELRRFLTWERGHSKPYEALTKAGYETVDDIRDADPRDLKDIEGVGYGTLVRLTEEIEGFDATHYSVVRRRLQGTQQEA